MLTKQVTFLGSTNDGVFCHGLFGSAGAFEKTAGAPPFSDWETGDELRKYISKITAEDRKKYCYVLVNALGAGEYFGSNINADYFPWDALTHEGDDYGYKTFLNSHVFQHHRNKDPARAFGVPVLSILNVSMKRVELIIRLDRDKTKVEGADGIITRIDAGEFPSVSMGCKVPYDVCSICGHRSKTRKDYCEHMDPPEELRHVFGPNKILIDGRQICVHNLHPRFFDLSFVFIGADKTAKVMAKLAQMGRQLCMGDVCTLSVESPLLYGPTGEPIYDSEKRSSIQVPTALEKTASCDCACGGACEDKDGGISKLASVFGSKLASEKLSEIVKEIPSTHFALRRLLTVEKSEPDLSTSAIDEMAKKPVQDAVGGLSGLGMVLKPHEFQRLVLVRMGENELADSMDASQEVFRPSKQFTDMGVAPAAELSKEILPIIQKYIHSRTAFGEPFVIRITIRTNGDEKSLPTRSPIAHPLLDKISAAYNGYRRAVMMKLSEAREVVCSDPKLREAVLGDGLVNMFSKTSSPSRIISRDSVAYLMGAHLDRDLLCTTAVADAIAASNPWLLEEP